MRFGDAFVGRGLVPAVGRDLGGLFASKTKRIFVGDDARIVLLRVARTKALIHHLRWSPFPQGGRLGGRQVAAPTVGQ